MDFSKLENNLTDVIIEEQLKLGYRKEVLRLYYPLLSLNRLLGTGCDVPQMSGILEDFCQYAKERLGSIRVTERQGRFCFWIPEQGAEYVHEHMEGSGLLKSLIEAVSKHGTTIEDVLQIFYRCSSAVHMEKIQNGEFDYLIYFENGEPDDYRYCIKEEGCHISYHRFTPDDYKDFLFDAD